MAERRNKYGSMQTVHEGRVYDSKLEADVARVLDLLQKQGRVHSYQRQVLYELAPKRTERGERAVTYAADFVVYPPDLSARAVRGDHSGAVVIEAKGYATAVGRLKLRWFTEMHPDIPLRVVHAPEDVITVIEDIESARAGKESSNAQRTDDD